MAQLKAMSLEVFRKRTPLPPGFWRNLLIPDSGLSLSQKLGEHGVATSVYPIAVPVVVVDDKGKISGSRLALRGPVFTAGLFVTFKLERPPLSLARPLRPTTSPPGWSSGASLASRCSETVQRWRRKVHSKLPAKGEAEEEVVMLLRSFKPAANHRPV